MKTHFYFFENITYDNFVFIFQRRRAELNFSPPFFQSSSNALSIILRVNREISLEYHGDGDDDRDDDVAEET